MQRLPNVLVILAAIGLLVGLVIRLTRGGLFADPVFFWRGSLALLVLSIAVSLIQPRTK
jgi:hypothetical protein